MQGKRGVRSALLAAGLLGAAALGYSAVEAPQSVAQDPGKTLNCKIPKASISLTHTDVPEGQTTGGVYKMVVPTITLSGDDGCGKLEGDTIQVEDDRPDYKKNGSCAMSVKDITDPDSKFMNGSGTVTADLSGEKSKFKADAVTSDKPDTKAQRNKKVHIEGTFTGLTGDCVAGGLKDSTVKLSGGTVTFSPKSS
ncbi:hypothetical protein [Nocardia sp. NPDC051570]|uniref:hypothetical protein n=1 Tax=Nocardia sp. NPDC051570 TaxID=3364324 RepID=UPI0037B36001